MSSKTVANLFYYCNTEYMNGRNLLSRRLRKLTAGGFTLTEILIVVSILLILLMLVLHNLQIQIMRSRDSQRKTDLHNIQKAFEEYFNDKQCYPYDAILTRCNDNDLQPYQQRVPCDPTTKEPYLYVPGAPTLCSGYRVCAKLEYTKDPDITRIGCDPLTGCGWSPGYNYCLSTGFDVAKTSDNGDTAGTIYAGPSATPTPTPQYAGTNVCRKGGGCDDITPVDPLSLGCPSSFAESDCQGLCNNAWYWCAQ